MYEVTQQRSDPQEVRTAEGRESSAAQLTKGRLQDAGSTNSTVSRLSGRPSLRWWKESTQNGQVGGPAQSSENPS